MFRIRMLALLAAVVTLAGSLGTVSAAETQSGSVYCFTEADFSTEEAVLTGICITGLPQGSLGAVMLGTRVVQPGDILTADQVSRMTFRPADTWEDASAQITYLPIYDGHVAPQATMTLAIRGRQDLAPVAEDGALETYKNLENKGSLKVSDPEGEHLTYSLIRQPRRGSVVLHEDGSFTYTPKKNKVGVDSFTYTATDPAGNVSREATVTITILKPTDATQYTDTTGRECRFSAEWMKNTGIFTGERVAGACCFQPDKAVTRGEFLTMLVGVLGLEPEADIRYTGYTDEIPGWLQPYLAAAVRSGLTGGLPDHETFGADQPITGAEAAVMLQNALDLAGSEAVQDPDSQIPVWAQSALAVMNSNGIPLDQDILTREEAAQVLYRVWLQLDSAPGMAVLRQH